MAHVRKEFVVVDDARFAECHASTVLPHPDGLLVAWFGGSREGAGDVAIWLARRTPGRGWTRAVKVADEDALPRRNPVLVAAADGEISLVYRVGGIPTWRTRVIRSADGGHRWSEPEDLVPGDEGGRGPVEPEATGLPSNDSGLDLAQLPDGRLVCVHNPVGASWGARAPLTAAISGDGGATWRHWVTLEEAAPGDRAEFSYPAAVRDGDGIAVTYTWRRRGIVSARLTPQDA